MSSAAEPGRRRSASCIHLGRTSLVTSVSRTPTITQSGGGDEFARGIYRVGDKGKAAKKL